MRNNNARCVIVKLPRGVSLAQAIYCLFFRALFADGERPLALFVMRSEARNSIVVIGQDLALRSKRIVRTDNDIVGAYSAYNKHARYFERIGENFGVVA